MESQIMITSIDLPWRWRVAAHRTCTQEEAAGGGGRTVAPPGVKDCGAPSLHLRPFHVGVVHLRTICLLECRFDAGGTVQNTSATVGSETYCLVSQSHS